MIWFLIPLMTMPTVIMAISIMAMSHFSGYITFIGIGMLIFCTNIVPTIAEQSTKTKIIFYLITLLLHLVVPLIVFLIGLFVG